MRVLQKAELERRQQILAKAKADRDEAKRQFGAFCDAFSSLCSRCI